MKRRKNILILLTGIFLLGLTIFAWSNSFHGSFQFDDNHIIIDNKNVTEGLIFSQGDLWTNINSRPLSQLTFAIDHKLWGLNPLGYHITNLLIHIINGLLFFLLIKTIFEIREKSKTTTIATMLATGLFLLHPLQTEAVTYIAQRMTSFSAMFAFLTMIFYIRTRLLQIKSGWRPSFVFRYALVVVSILLCILGKQTGIILFPMIIATEFILIPSARKDRLKVLSATLLLFLIGIVIVLLNDGFLTRDSEEIGRLSYALTQLKIIPYYIALSVFPAWQNADHSISLTSGLFSFEGLIGIAGLIIWILLFLYFLKKNRLLAYGMAFFSIALSVESSIFPIRDLMVEHRMYFPLAGLIMIILSLKINRLWISSMIIFASIMAILTFNRNRVWENALTLWEDTVIKSPEKSRPNLNYGLALLEAGKVKESIDYLEKSISIKPDNPDALNNLGIAFYRSGRRDEALASFHKALSWDPRYKHALNNTGMVWLDAGDPKMALYYFYQATLFDAHFAEAYYNAALAAEMGKSPWVAEKCYLAAIRQNKNYNDAIYNLGNLYMSEGKSAEAEKCYLLIPENDKNYPNAMNNLASMKVIQGKKSEAIELYMKVLANFPDHPEALNNLEIISKDK